LAQHRLVESLRPVELGGGISNQLIALCMAHSFGVDKAPMLLPATDNVVSVGVAVGSTNVQIACGLNRVD